MPGPVIGQKNDHRLAEGARNLLSSRPKPRHSARDGVRQTLTIVGALGATTEAVVSLGRSRILGRIWDQPEQKEKDVYELTEILECLRELTLAKALPLSGS
jgi:hypothetical protein